MAIYIVGGSNSLLKHGWVSVFQRDHAEVVNLSVGATTSLTGLFRMMTTPEIAPGDVVVWEYALNEANHIRRGHTPRVLLEHLEYLLRYAQEHGIRVAPAVFTPWRLEKHPTRRPYYRQLDRLLAHYGLRPFDMSVEYRAALGRAVLPKTAFKDKAHYAQSDEVLGFIARGVARAVAEATVPVAVKPLLVRGQKLDLVTSFANDVFENSIMRVPVARMPFRFDPARRAELEAVTFFSSPQRDAFEVVLPYKGIDQVLPFSATHRVKRSAALLKTALVPPARSMRTAPGEPMRFETWRGTGRLVVAYGCKKKLARPGEEPLAQIAGVFFVTRSLWARLNHLARTARSVILHRARRLRRPRAGATTSR